MRSRRTFALSFGLHVALAALVWGASPARDVSTRPQPIEIQTLRSVKTPSRSLDQKIAARPSTSLRSTNPAAPTDSRTANRPETPPAPTTETRADGDGHESAETSAALSAQSRYELYVRSQIAKKKTYPPTARRLGHTGRVILKFRVLASGEVQAAELAQKSAHESLNQDALKILRGLARLEPIPNELGRAEWLFVVPVDYDLN